ncbi:MAG: serine/threonine protein kinase [Deltaproteobacteria bacterium]|nr:serine/threonine protein kinase [Deltaproteobacteria bacterium]
MNDGAPQRFGRYTLVRRLAWGGMGELYIAERSGFAGFSKRVVVKCIRRDLAGDDEFVQMFLDEGRLAAMITHPNVVQIYELGQVDGQYFMAMEYVPGKNLAEIVNRLQGPIKLPHAVGILVQLCSALTAAHEAKDAQGTLLQLVHRDVSPPNILVSFSGAVKLTDFGIAKVAMRERQTRAGVVKGKFAYLSPEQVLGKDLDARADIYALGLVLFEASVGRMANPGSTEVEQIYAASQGEVLDPADIISTYPEELRQIFLRATKLDPSERFQRAHEMQKALVGFLGRHEMMTNSPQLAEYMQRLFPRDAVAAGEGALLGQQTRESSLIMPVPAEKLEPLAESCETVVSNGFSEEQGEAAMEGVRAYDEVTTEQDYEGQVRELGIATLMVTPSDDDQTLVTSSTMDMDGWDDVTSAARPSALRSSQAAAQPKPSPKREGLHSLFSSGLGRVSTESHPLEFPQESSPEPARPPEALAPVSKIEQSPRRWYKQPVFWISVGFILLVFFSALLGSFLVGSNAHQGDEQSVEEAP